MNAFNERITAVRGDYMRRGECCKCWPLAGPNPHVVVSPRCYIYTKSDTSDIIRLAAPFLGEGVVGAVVWTLVCVLLGQGGGILLQQRK